MICEERAKNRAKRSASTSSSSSISALPTTTRNIGFRFQEKMKIK
jgi:hypothetical protein